MWIRSRVDLVWRRWNIPDNESELHKTVLINYSGEVMKTKLYRIGPPTHCPIGWSKGGGSLFSHKGVLYGHPNTVQILAVHTLDNQTLA